MAITRKPEFIEYLRALNERSEPDTSAERIEIFERAIGKTLPELEAGWREHVRRLAEPSLSSGWQATESDRSYQAFDRPRVEVD